MKTADLIPFILIELNESDKYGFELTKDIETKSNGKIIIKQPTLYTVLKKLEKSKFISSYWEDSEIGGKRHYYKITDNGRMQLSTLPSYEVLLNNLEKEESEENDETINNNPDVQPLEAIMPSSEVFADSNIDNSTELSINKENSELLNQNLTEAFATNTSVSEFTKNNLVQTTEIKQNVEEIKTDNVDSYELVNLNYEMKIDTDVKYQEYKNIKKSESYIKSKQTGKFIILKTLTTSVVLFVAALLVYLITTKTGRSSLFYIYFITSLVICIFYPIIIALNLDKLIKRNIKKNYNFTLSILLSTMIVALTFVIILVVNISINNTSFGKIFAVSNFENIYAPLVLSLCSYCEYIFAKIYLKQKTKQIKEKQ